MGSIRTLSRLIGWIALLHIAGVALVAAEPLHPYHVSRAEVAWNPKSGNFEVALCVWPADLEQALSRQANRPIDLQNEKQLEPLAQRYLASRFLIRPKRPEVTTGGDEKQNPDPSVTADPVPVKEGASSPPAGEPDEAKPPTLRWVGQEVGLKQAWLYFEVAGDPAISDWTLENRVFFELNADQLNHVQWSLGKQYETFVCQPDQPSQPCSTTQILRARD